MHFIWIFINIQKLKAPEQVLMN